MPVEPNATLLESSDDAVIWRFMDLRKFRDLMASEELYFRRADLFSDSSEGLPPDQYALRVFGLDPYDIKDRASLNHHMGSLAQHRECYYISCWHLFRQEQLGMWEQYGHDGVAVCSRYELLKAALDGLLDEASLGLVRYGTDHLENTFNTIQFITTKQPVYAPECEVRAWLTVYNPLAGGNRHFDLDNFPHPRPLNLNPRHSWVPDSKRRRIDLRSLITDVVVSPWAEADAVEDIEIWVKAKGFPASSTPSALRGNHTPTLEEFRRARRLTGGGTHEPATADEVPATGADLDRLYDVLSGLTPSRVRWLYRQRWETCRLNPGQLPLVSDLQYLQTTLKVLDDWRRQGIDVG